MSLFVCVSLCVFSCVIMCNMSLCVIYHYVYVSLCIVVGVKNVKFIVYTLNFT